MKRLTLLAAIVTAVAAVPIAHAESPMPDVPSTIAVPDGRASAYGETPSASRGESCTERIGRGGDGEHTLTRRRGRRARPRLLSSGYVSDRTGVDASP
jgi:hypothetical protein